MNPKPGLIAVALLASLVLFMAGWYSGLYAHDVITETTNGTVLLAKEQINGSVTLAKEQIKDQIRAVELQLDSAQTERIFVDTLPDEKACSYLKFLSQNLMYDFESFWSRLPPRLEALNPDEAKEFEPLRDDYNQLSVRAWVFFRQVDNKCGLPMRPILYFYETGCEPCIRQGIELDALKSRSNSTVLAFVVDAETEYTVAKHIMAFYGVDETPAIIAGDSAWTGVVSADELAKITGAE